MIERTILSLCEISGEASRPYREAGYNVRMVDIKSGQDVRLLRWPGRVHGVMAFPPCTHFSRAGAWKWKEKGEQALLDGLSIVDACLRLVTVCRPVWWMLENPIGRLKDYLGEPAFRFDPCDFGDAWTKRTWLWGNFAPPISLLPGTPREVAPEVAGNVGRRDRTTNTSRRGSHRSITPAGFARAFFVANP